MTGESINSKALILLTSRPESVEIAEMEMGPKVLGVTISQDILLGVAARCSELGTEGVESRYRMVEDPMEIGDAFAKFELMLSELEDVGYGREEILLDATGGTTPMRLGCILAAMTCGISMSHQRVPQCSCAGAGHATLRRL
jgi:hypothetical protein